MTDQNTKSFIHLHVHSEYSLLDGAIKLSNLVNKAKELNMPAIALTDHGVMFGIVEFFEKAVAAGIKPIIGCEVYLAPRTRHDKDAKIDKGPSHLTMLAKDEIGYKNLLKMVSQAHLDGFFYKPRVDWELLEKYSEGLVCLSGCLAGPIIKQLLNSNANQALDEAKKLHKIFKDDFYIEIQDQGLEEQAQIREDLIEIARKLKIPLVATNDAHYLTKDDAKSQDILLAIQTGKTLDDPNRLSFSSDQFYIKNTEEMSELFKDIPEAITNTQLIANKCNFELTLGKFFLPDFPVPAGETAETFLEKIAWKGLGERYTNITEPIKERFYYELRVIKKMGFSSYFLIVADLIGFAKNNGISVGPGRGSAAGSIIAYSLGITNIDPLQFKLLFERFLNPDRISMPDIDIDFCIENRQRVIEYTKEKYGEDHVAQIITFGRMAARMAIRDVGRALAVPLSEVDMLAKLVPFGSTIQEALEESSDLQSLYKSRINVKELIDAALKIEGIARHSGIHAAGVVISQKPLVEMVPIIVKDKQLVTMFPKDELENVGLLKMDFLGLRNLTMITRALELIEESKGEKVDIDHIPFDDKETYNSLSLGNSIGVFQLESTGMQGLLKSLQPTVFEDIVALLALYRPGPLGSGMDKDFVNRKHGRQKLAYPLPQLEPILKDTYGTILYQEQVMHIASVVGQFSMSEADTLRKAMGKKKIDVMDKMKQKFIDGAIAQDIDGKKAAAIFDMMAKFAEYGFNKSHSAAYAFITYQTAYLKTHYPVEYMAALISSSINDTDKVSQYIAEARKMGIEITPPDINGSKNRFSIRNNIILFGLGAIKNVGANAIESIIASREKDGLFHSLIDFCTRVDLRQVNKRVLESLIKAGTFSSFGKRKALLSILEKTHNEANKIQKEKIKGQLNLFSQEQTHIMEQDRELSDDEFSQMDLLKLEKEMLGIYVTGHPIEDYIATLENSSFINLTEAQKMPKETVKVVALLTGLSKRYTKRKRTMMIGNAEDLTGSAPIVIFPDAYDKLGPFLIEDKIVQIIAKSDFRNDQFQLIVEDIKEPPQKAKPITKIYINAEQPNEKDIESMKTTLLEHTGRTPVYCSIDGYQILLNKKYWVDSKRLKELRSTLIDCQVVAG